MKALVKTAATRLGVYDGASRFWIRLEPRLVRVTRAVTGRNRRLISRYLAEHPVARLHIGCGGNVLAGWLNTDLCPRGSQVYLDATRPFPLPDHGIDTVYTEHMIEHLPWTGAHAMLRECYRVMKPGAIIRIVTPNLDFLLRVLASPEEPAHAAYIQYSLQQYRIAAGSAVHVFNNFMRAWGHQFIYDEVTLRRLMSGCGFTGITACRLNDSSQPALAGLAKIDRMPDGVLEMESFAIEARKP